MFGSRVTKSATDELRAQLFFTQRIFHSSKQQGHTFHVTTVANSTGEAVVQYFSGQVKTPNMWAYLCSNTELIVETFIIRIFGKTTFTFHTVT